MLILIIYFVLAVGISCVCSITESGLLSLTRGDVAKLVQSGRRSGKALQQMKSNVNRPLAAILTLNTIANCYGAAGVGSESENLWGDAGMAYASAALTLTILIFSEIIPKSLGARFATRLADFTAPAITVMVYVTYPITICLQSISRLVGGDEPERMSREDVDMAVQVGRDDGVLAADEADVIKNFLAMTKLTVRDIMTPMSAVDTLRGSCTVSETIADQPTLPHSRLPVVDGAEVIGVVRRDTVYACEHTGKSEARIADIARPIPRVHATTSLRESLDAFQSSGIRILLVEDDDHNALGIMATRDILMKLIGSSPHMD